MMKTKKKPLLIAVAFLGLAVIIGFFIYRNVKTEPVTAENATWYFDYMGRSFSDIGCFYQESGYLHFCDPSSGMDVLICAKAECRHEKESCPAYVDSLYAYAWAEGDRLFLLTDYGSTQIGEMGLYEASLNGENRKRIASFENVQNITKVLLSGQWIFFAYYNQYDENMEPLGLEEAGILAYDRSSGKSSRIWCDTKKGIIVNDCVYDDGYVYFTCLYYDLNEAELTEHEPDDEYVSRHQHYELVRVSMNSECEVLCGDIEDIEGFDICGKNIFFNSGGTLFAYDSATGKSRELADSMYEVAAFVEHTAVFRKTVSGEKSICLYNDETNKLETVGKKQDDTIPVAVFPTYTYVWDYSDGNGVLAYLTTEKFLKGAQGETRSFEKTE